jgi:acyl-CoA dehydrogenase
MPASSADYRAAPAAPAPAPGLAPLLTQVLSWRGPAPSCEQVSDWWPAWLAIVAEHASPIARAVAGGAQADRAGWAFAAGYQASLRALLRAQPGLLPDDAMSVFCVSEKSGNRPADIQCRLEPMPGGYRLSGAKSWATLGPAGNFLLVAARLPPHDAARPQLRMVRVRAEAPGVTITLMPPTAFVPEVPHARLTFEEVVIADDEVLPGDGYERYIKPFRTVEDIHVTAALLACALAEACRRDWPTAWRERAAMSLLGFEALSQLDPAAPLTQLALTGALAGSSALFEEANAWWQATPKDPASLRWARDARLFAVASGVRQQRALRAWERLAAG